MTEQNNNQNSDKKGGGCGIIPFLLISLVIYWAFDYEWYEWPAIIGYHIVIFIQDTPLTCNYNTPYPDENEICRQYIKKKEQEIRDELNELLAKREKRIKERDRKRTPEELHEMKVRYGLIEDTEKEKIIKPDPEQFVDLKEKLKDLSNIKFKLDDRSYNINRKVYNSKRFASALKEINKTMEIVITETTRGKHKKGAYSHEKGYKIDIRTKDKSYPEIKDLMNIFHKYGFKVAFEHENTPESLELAEKIKLETEFPVRPADIGEHVDVNLSGLNANLSY